MGLNFAKKIRKKTDFLSGVTKGSSQGGNLSWRGPIDHRLGMQWSVPKNSYKLFRKNSDVISLNWVNDFKVEIHVFM